MSSGYTGDIKRKLTLAQEKRTASEGYSTKNCQWGL